jgi:F-type H+-transporting ATPase subunit b
MLSIEPGLLIWTIITFVVLLFVLRKVAWGPILAALAQREDNIRSSLEEAQRARQEVQQLMIQHQQLLAEANRESARVLEQAREEAQRLQDTLVGQAREEVQRLREETRREIEREKRLAVQDLKAATADLALAAAGHLLKTAVDRDNHRRLVTEFLDRFPDGLQ